MNKENGKISLGAIIDNKWVKGIGGGAGLTAIVILVWQMLSPMILVNTNKIDTNIAKINELVLKHEKLVYEFEPIKLLPKDFQKLKEDFKDLKTMFILVNKDNPDLKKYLELNK